MVADLAQNGDTEAHSLELAMQSLLNQNPASLEALYGPPENLTRGMQSMAHHLGKAPMRQTSARPEALRYLISILYLARKLSKDPKMLQKIAEGIANGVRQAEHFSATHENVFSNIATLYQQTVSTMRLRIQVSGNGLYLQQTAVATRIRCLLFAAIRSAFLWQQLGGRRSHLMLQRKALVRALPDYLSD
jgi:high frequency lysogenization protein